MLSSIESLINETDSDKKINGLSDFWSKYGLDLIDSITLKD